MERVLEEQPKRIVEAMLMGAVREAKRELFLLLSPAEQRTVVDRRSDALGERGRTFEDAARDITRGDTYGGVLSVERREAVGVALGAFQAAVNAMWAQLIAEGAPARLVNQWKSLRYRAWRRLIVVAAPGELESEAAVALRTVIAMKSFDPSRGASFLTYARKHVWQALDMFAKRSLTIVSVSDRATRTMGPADRDLSYEDVIGRELEAAMEEREV